MTHAIVLNSLTKYFGDQRAISNISFEVPSGTVFGYLGPNGAGKSTTIRLLLGLYRPTFGNARVLGLDPRDGNVELLRRVGYLPGELNLFPRLTGREILDRFASARGLADYSVRDLLVERFRVELDRPVRTLSKGNRQKIGLVLAFQHQPDLLILDEPTSGLDPLLQDEFATLLRETVAEGRTVFLSSHDLDEVQRVVHELAIIKEGRIIVTDTVEGLRSRAAKTISLRFPQPPDVEAFRRLPGVEIRSATDYGIGLALTGPVAALLELAGQQGAIEIVARPPDLDEVFLSFYGDSANAGVSHVG